MNNRSEDVIFSQQYFLKDAKIRGGDIGQENKEWLNVMNDKWIKVMNDE